MNELTGSSDVLLREREDHVYHRERVVERYLSTLPEAEQETSEVFADMLKRPDKPLASTIVMIPVATHQEKANIAPAINQYARQETSTPFTIVLGLNTAFAPDQTAQNEITACETAVDKAIHDHPELDIRTTTMRYIEPTIGEIRRDIWNGVLTLAHDEGRIEGTNDVIGINHDIDLVSLPRHYIATVQKYMSNPTRNITPACTPLRHAFDQRFPNTSRAVRWNDFLHQQFHTKTEASSVIPLTYYASKGGIDPTKITHEVGSLISNDVRKQLLPTGTLHTSPRRMILRLPQHDFSSIWTEDSFKTTDDCRKAELPHIAQDISHQRLQALASEQIGQYSNHFAYVSDGEIAQRIHRQQPSLTDSEFANAVGTETIRFLQTRKRLATRVLRELVGLKNLSMIFDAQVCTSKQMLETAEHNRSAYESL